MKVTVFGSARPQPGEKAYEDALSLGEKLGAAGYTVLTGGYSGTMEAVSQGVAKSGGHVIGVTCEEIEAWRPTGANVWVQEEWRQTTLQQRMQVLMENGDAIIALPGGIGTLTEIMYVWNHQAVDITPSVPLILVGTGWKEVFQQFVANQKGYVSEQDYRRLSFVAETVAAYDVLIDKL